MPITWNYLLAALSVVVAMVGSFTALAHAGHMRDDEGRAAWIWMLAGGITLGLAIWSMHFIGMLAMHFPMEVSYDRTLTLLSPLPAIAAALLGFYVLRTEKVSFAQILFSGILMGLGISAMHYTGMAALKMLPAIAYDPWIVALSILIAIGVAWSALFMMYRGDRFRLPAIGQLALGGTVMGVAIAGMHYTAWTGMDFAAGSVCLSGPSRIDNEVLALMVSLVSLLWFLGGIIAALLHQHIKHINLRAEGMAQAMTRELRDSEDKMRAMIDAALDCIITINADGKITHFNRAAEQTFGYRKDFVIGRNVAEIIIPPHYRERHLAGMQHFLSTGETRVMNRRVELSAMRADGSEFPAELTITRLNREGPPLLTAFLRDITDRKKAESEIHNLAFYDALTQLPNRRLMRDRLQHALATCSRYHGHGAVLFIDLDNFKTLNDTRGHALGDMLLVEVGLRLRHCIRGEDTIARLGGDEFVVMLENLHNDAHIAAIEAEQVGDKLRLELSQPYLLQGLEYHSTCSVGIALFSDASISVDELLKRADTAMYESKRAGRNAVRFFDPDMQAELEQRTALESDLRHALKRGEFVMYYQPQVNDAYRIVSAEVLLRWNHPRLGLVAPTQFIPIAEDTGLILPIGQWVLESACHLLKEWESSAATRDLELAVNVSARQFRQASFVDQVRRVLKKTGVAPSRLKLELTESLVLDNVEDSIQKMEALRTLGIRFSMDDFGTGHSSLTYLKRLPLTQLKIDQSFVRDIATDPNDSIIVQTIIGMAKNLGLGVIAEGVETSEQLGYLQNYGCPAFQGYLFGEPLPYREFARKLPGGAASDTLADIAADI
jgi:diguanylate cyclase (GGDEF)-like protein/PAS domain S-box-containing protein